MTHIMGNPVPSNDDDHGVYRWLAGECSGSCEAGELAVYYAAAVETRTHNGN